MLFSTLTFIIVFLPIVFGLYSVRNLTWRNGVLILCSLGFYAWGGVSYSIILVGSILLNYLVGKQITKRKKGWLTFGVVANLTILFTFKYLDFFIENINGLIGSDIPLQNIKLPLGISFFTFQGMSFLIDVYRSEEEKKIRLDETTLYISFFPQLIAGPIIRYNDIIEQIRKRTVTLFNFNKGTQRFIIGLFKKVVIANTMGTLADQIMDLNPGDLSSTTAWLGILAYSLQIYYDFSAYSDMAIGLGAMLGFDILENFNYPYISRSIREFWRRWHISLSSWFRDYLYIPLGGNQKGKYRTYINLGIVFLLTGFWHGATWSFIFWGIFHGFFMIIERLFFGKTLEKMPAIISWLYSVVVVMTAWVFFRIEDFGDAFSYATLLFSFKGEALTFLQYLDNEKILILGLAILFATPIYPKISLFKEESKLQNVLSFVRVNVLIPVLFLLSIAVLTGSTYNPFIYFRF